MLKEFKAFLMRGNVLDLAVAVVIGAAFGGIVTSLVNDLLMPPIGLLLGNVDFAEFYVLLREGTTPGPYATLAAAREAGAVTVNYGAFVNAVIQFVIVGAAIFTVIRSANRLTSPTPAPAPAPMKECPHCCTSVPERASRCPACTASLAG